MNEDPAQEYDSELDSGLRCDPDAEFDEAARKRFRRGTAIFTGVLVGVVALVVSLSVAGIVDHETLRMAGLLLSLVPPCGGL
jgi:hypothetical protein